ncbi:OsmC family protein [Actinobacillus equuli]|uniref:OsmC family protein n=1 Tax=Actinobacillus equuli TaxID=718 RepID=UPI0024428D1A|nr:OsmC family protein [Actinobacillus equuli]WGE48640.1 OsmC family protein [Actinobacillus equuli subsp. equuli]WGE52901.1 OsmC family protein [Actinobacillus equuli subsp. haemolyticus]
MTKPYVDPNKVAEVASAVKNEPKLGQFTVTMTSQSNGGVGVKTRTGKTVHAGIVDESRVGKFETIGDEPEAVLGEDKALSPMEYALQALAGCYTATLTLLAAGKGIELEKIELNLEADFDLNGFLKFDPSVRNGASEIRVDIHVESSNASRAEVEALIAEIPNHSPLYDMFTNPVPVVHRIV